MIKVGFIGSGNMGSALAKAAALADGVSVYLYDKCEGKAASVASNIGGEFSPLEKLISDGRIHPARIEEMVEKAKRDVESSIKQEGDKAVFECGVHGLHIELTRL